MIKDLHVSLNKTRIGTLCSLQSGATHFSFHKDYINDALRPTLTQSLLTPSGELIQETKLSSTKLPPFFSNLLPEGPLRDYLAQKGGYALHRSSDLLNYWERTYPGLSLSLRQTV